MQNMKWTSEKPTEEGWYWWQNRPFYSPKIIPIYKVSGSLCHGQHDGQSPYWIDQMDGQFAGPIPDPEE
jgi:hypothetical protein